MNARVQDSVASPAAASALPGSTGHGWRVATGTALTAVTVAVVVAGLRVQDPAGLPAVQAVGYALCLAWAVAAVAASVAPGLSGQWQLAAGALTGAIGLTAARLGSQPPPGAHGLARAVATIAGPLVIAASAHFVLAAPDGRLISQARRITAIAGYLAALVTGLLLAVTGHQFSRPAAMVIWPVVLLAVLPAARLRYLRLGGRDRERMQWLAVGLVLAANAALVCGVLHLLVGWPGPVGAVAAAATAAVPAGLVASTSAQLAPLAGRLLVHVLSLAGFSVVVSAIYVVIVLGLGQRPADHGGRQILGLSMLAAAVAAIGYLPARDRLLGSATRFVYGAKEAPDEVLRTFGSRMTRAVAMDELLLQLAESLRKTMGLTSAEIYTGTGDVLELAVSVPDAGRRSIVLGDRERPVVTRAGVSGNAWTSVWLPSLLAGRDRGQLRVAPISHAGELLGLLVIERPASADVFSEEDERVLTELARQAGLAFYNVQLDAALQTTLDELRHQADELRESRARVVASGDAERRRVERDLHDGAQQHLVALAVNLRLATDIIADDPAAGIEMLGAMAEDVQATIREVRELAHGIYPPLLADNGLGEALRAAASRSPLAVTVHTDGIGRYSQGVETAVYFCCLEALQNAGKHAAEAAVQVRLWQESGGLLFSVSDDGPGFDAAQARGGHGFVNMSDRLGAIGGTVRWESQPGHGTTISGSVPILDHHNQ
ncbi:MAG TPA: GAF domain-containing sensor histidine kinase [Streptosporangiaceae bacterium]|nr:GAF domain-containing sensor histidine kinase [Streptosporangiaceae bacterium]